MKTYLKTEKYGIELKMFDSNKLIEIRIYKGKEIAIINFDDLEDLRDSMKRDIGKYNYYLIDEMEFNKAFEDFKNELLAIQK